MLSMTCPACQETGKVPDTFLGQRIKCKKCGGSFLVTAQGAKSLVPSRSCANVPGGIEVEGLDQNAWTAAVSEPFPETRLDAPVLDSAADELFAPPAVRPPGVKEYKILTSRDKWFEGKYDIGRLEEALNAFALQGWVVRLMATPHLPVFSGGVKEELVVLLER